MKRLLPWGTAFVLVVTACGAGAKPAPQATSDPVHDRPSLHAIAAARKRTAEHEAETLLKRILLPAGVRRIREPAVLSRGDIGVSILNEIAYRHAFWRVRLPLDSVYAFVKAHPLRGFRYGGGGGLYRSLDFYNGVAGPKQRLVTVAMVRSAGKTLLRVDAGVAWIYPRSPHEVVPAGVRGIDIRNGRLRRRVTDPARLTRIVRWFDALNVVQPGTNVVGCPLILASRVTFVFRSAGGAELASAVAPSAPASGCYPIEFTIGRKRQTPLIDSTSRKGAFVYRVQRLLGVRFIEPRH